MKTYAPAWWMRYRDPIRAVLFPARAAWSLANRLGWLAEPPIGMEPYLHPDALDYWRTAMVGAVTYMEYGAGGSTMEAVQSARHVFSLETDRRYLAAVARNVATVDGSAAFHPLCADIGWTSKWGQPLVTRANKTRLARWRRYPAAPWVALEQHGFVPDFIFIDGRFRLASVLESLVRLPTGADCRFLLDDFEPRAAAYAPMLDFIDGVTPLGDAIAFRRRTDFARAACLEALEKAYADPL